ncbi:unnamed protein product, partial [marine sediment metagenome]
DGKREAEAEMERLREDNEFLNARVRQLTDFDYAVEREHLTKEIREAQKRTHEAEADNRRLQERGRELGKALYAHRADLHCYSSRPCPTCRNSAEVLGIADKVPYCCSREETDTKARESIQHKEGE